MVKATFEFVGLTEYLKKLDTLGAKSTGFIKRAVYDGAAVVSASQRCTTTAELFIRNSALTATIP